ncbi:hypothetical protein COLO4_31692 [Corchorus olitorius]|uniref:Gnk2-homologous domain-containing protein n=1 Tax=Corchorus olitorius TaxID=93759 RepID=A0A1R3H3N8_9ROSI|nr:hypothetical protein COLO4_31692 [Corchorus olitorius]
MALLYKSKTFLLFLIVILEFISLISCQSPTYTAHSCLGPGNDTVTASYKSNLTALLDSISSKAVDQTFYNDSLNGIYSLFLCRGDVSSNICQVCVKNATQTLTQRCPSDKRAVIWYDECMLRYSDTNFFGLVRLFPRLLMWNPNNSTSPEEGNIGTQGLIFSLVDHGPYTENMFETNEMLVGNGPGRRFGLVQCSRDLNVSDCSSCLRSLLDQTEECCLGKTGWRILTPSCLIRYEMYRFYEEPSAPPPENQEEGMSQEILLRSSRGSKPAHLMEAGLHLSDEDDNGEMHYIDLATIQAATNNFSRANKLGEGGFGPVYKAWMLWNEGKGEELIDPNITNDCLIQDVLRWIHIALLCVQDDPALRPPMSAVVLMLGSKSVNLPQPSTPPYSAARFATMSDHSSTCGTNGTGLPTSDLFSTTASS